MAWLQLKYLSQASQADALDEALSAAGAASVTYMDAADQPIFEPELGTSPIWPTTQVIGLFPADADIEEIKQKVELFCLAQQTPLPATPPKAEILEDKDWQEAWKSHYQPMQFGQLWICPSWLSAPDPKAPTLMLDPGLAFGTGTHPTTALCLHWLSQLNCSGKQIIDYGCGSGILAIAALLLGGEQALGIDIDPQALQASRTNAQRNSLSDQQLKLCHPDQTNHAAEGKTIAADIVVANILTRPLIMLAPALAQLVKPGGQLGVSGVLARQADEVTQAYQPWFDLQKPRQQDDWVLISGRRH